MILNNILKTIVLYWGITVILIIISGLFVGSYFFKYPEIITSKVTIFTENPPVALKSFSTGKITKLFVAENQYVTEHTVIALIENTADYKAIKTLQTIIDTLQNTENFPDNINLNLGEIQPQCIFS